MTFKIYLAPIRGITDAAYRNTFSEYFSGIDLAVAPFISTLKGNTVKSSQISGLLPENNTGMPVIPQILSKDADGFIFLAKYLFDLGYQTVNWNLGCPFPTVANKQRGSGMLPYPDRIDGFLEKVFSEIPNALSVKTRLGRNSAAEIFRLMPVFNRYPLKEIIIHPRTGVQMYDGKPDLETFEACLALAANPVVYNGDINSPDTFRMLSERFKTVNCWMIGRGVLHNPFLPEIIKSGTDSFFNKIEMMKHFHDTLFDKYSRMLDGPGHLLDRMKGFWKYFPLSFKHSGDIQRKIHKAKKTDQYKKITACFFEEEAQWDCSN
jgi:tRNA-dihydrouridine synthase